MNVTKARMKEKMKNNRDIEKGICPCCGAKFKKKAFWQIYCSSDCRLVSWIVKNAKPKILERIKNGEK